MSLQPGDLKDTILKKISFDEFEPKTGDERDVAVVGFYTCTQGAADDLYNFLNNSVVESRDVEVSPNPNDEGYYMAFVEMDRDDQLIDKLQSLVSEVENVAGKLSWQVKTPYIEDYISLQEADKYIQTSKEDYLTASEYKEKLEAELEKANLESVQQENILEFLQASSLLDAGINDNKVVMRGARDVAQLEIVNFGPAKHIMADVGINESAIKPLDSTLRQFNSMLGEMRAVPIDDYIVIFHPDQDNVLVTKQC